jgi:SAM-dependent methyltransferase
MEKSSHSLFIYGAGKYGARLLEYFQSIGCSVSGFIQTNEPEQQEYLGLEFFSFHGFCEWMESRQVKKEEICIAVAIANEDANREICENLLKIGILREHIWRYKEFLGVNRPLVKEVLPGHNTCNICGAENVQFETRPARGDELFFETHNVIGGGSRKNCICPVCCSVDRNRFVYWVLQNKTDIFSGGGQKILHFAPEKQIYDILKKQKDTAYYPCDLFPKNGMIKVDATDIPFKDDVFDFVIINHVMEHIPDELRALRELYRVLKPSGTVVLSVPICCDLEETFEDSSIVTPEDRDKYYGQKDHVRLYGRDYIQRFSQSGFDITEYSPNKEMNEDMVRKYGFIENDVVMLCRK